MMKKILLFVLLAGSLSSYAQGIFEIHYRHVPVENMQEFENLEMNYWYKVVQDAVDKGNLVSWSLHKRLDAGFVDFDEDAPTHAFVLVYKDIDQYLDGGKVWANASEILGADPSRFSTQEMSETLFRQRYSFVDGIGSSENGKFAVWNYAQPENVAGFLEENKKLWKPYFQKNMKKLGMVSWGVANRIYPQGQDQSSVVTWDVYSSLGAAMKQLANTELDPKIVSQSRMTEFNPEGFRYRVIMQTLKRTK